jgi:ribosomal protein S21
MSKPVNFEVKPKSNEDQMNMIRRFVKKTKKEGLIDAVRNRNEFTPKSEIRKLKKERKKKLSQESTRKFNDKFKD